MLALEKQTRKWMQLTAFLDKNNSKNPSTNKQNTVRRNWDDHQKTITHSIECTTVKTMVA